MTTPAKKPKPAEAFAADLAAGKAVGWYGKAPKKNGARCWRVTVMEFRQPRYLKVQGGAFSGSDWWIDANSFTPLRRI